MTKFDDGGQMFPVPADQFGSPTHYGASLWAYFAGQALPVAMQRADSDPSSGWKDDPARKGFLIECSHSEGVAIHAGFIADAMVAEMRKREKQEDANV